MPNFMSFMTKNISKSLKKKFTEAYEKTSPKVKQEIKKFVTSKTIDSIAVGVEVISAAIILIFVLKAINNNGVGNTSSDLSHIINTYYNRINVTYNYYYKGE